MGNELAIEQLERRVADLERKGNALVEVINDLRAEDGKGPRPPFGGSGGGGNSASHSGAGMGPIKPDTFYGKKLQTAAREYLEMRHAAARGTNPATPKEIYDAITAGGFQFDTKSVDNALVGLRALLRKRSAFFHKLPNGSYGLTNWYPELKKQKSASGTDSGDDDESDLVVDEKGTATAGKTAAVS